MAGTDFIGILRTWLLTPNCGAQGGDLREATERLPRRAAHVVLAPNLRAFASSGIFCVLVGIALRLRPGYIIALCLGFILESRFAGLVLMGDRCEVLIALGSILVPILVLIEVWIMETVWIVDLIKGPPIVPVRVRVILCADWLVWIVRHGKTSGVRLGSVPLNAFSNALYGQFRSNREGALI